jgi:hypothetical protein
LTRGWWGGKGGLLSAALFLGWAINGRGEW